MIDKASNPYLQISHMAITLLLSGGFVSYVNGVENKQVETDTKQQQIIKTQDEIREEIKEARKEQQERYEKLLEAIHESD